jgi:hypothetical protein
MSGKQNDKQPVYRTDSLVDTMWNEYESGVSRFRERVEEREAAYLSFVEESRKTSEEYGSNLEGIYSNFSKARCGRLKSVTEQMIPDSQLAEIAQKLESLASTPLKYSTKVMSQSGKRFEEGTREFIKVSREGRHAWISIHDEFLKLGREYQRTLLRGLEDTSRSFTGIGRS